MSMLNSVTGQVPNFMDEKPTDIDKICWKRAYATYLNAHNKTPEEYEKKTFKLTELLPVLQVIDRKYEHVEPNMMKTTHTFVQRMNMFLGRFAESHEDVHKVMYEVREKQDGSADVEQTHNQDRTDSEKSDSDPENEKPTELGLMNEPSTVEHQEPYVPTVDEVDHDEKPQVQAPQQEKVAVQTQTEPDTILQKRSRKEFDVTDTELGLYGPDLIAFFKARDTKRSAQKSLKEAQDNY